MGLPADLVFRTKGQLAIGLCADGFADGVWFDFVCGDEVYGNSTELREFCEDRGQGYVLRVRSTFHLVLAGGGEAVTCARAARALGKNNRRWEVRPPRAGSNGQRRYCLAGRGPPRRPVPPGPATPSTGRTGDAATRRSHAGTTSAPGSPVTPRLSWSPSE